MNMTGLIEDIVRSSADADGNVKIPVDQLIAVTTELRRLREEHRKLRNAALRLLEQNAISSQGNVDGMKRSLEILDARLTDDQKESIAAAVALWDAAKQSEEDA